MRETSFIEQNKHKWKEFENSFDDEKDPEKASNLFIQITDDLSYSRTYYPNRSVKIYLNNLAQKVFQSIYKNRVRRRRKLLLFWTDELPLQLFAVRKQLLFSLLLFLVSFGIGMFSSMHDPDFARFIMGDEYISMTEANIEKGDPMAVYKEMNQFDMFLGITVNNLWVAFITMIFGILLGVGSAYFIIYNGIMIGVFQYFFIERDLFTESFLTIWVHGALEVSAIIVAGAAGLTLGKGFVFPGTYTRMQAFRLNGMRAIQTFLGVAPIIVLAAINESFLTRYTETPDIVRALLIALEFAFMLYYFVLLPAAKVRRGDTVVKRNDEIPPDKKPEIHFQKIKTGGEVFSDSFTMLRAFLGPLLLLIGVLSLAYCFVIFRYLDGSNWMYHNQYIMRFEAIGEAISDIRHVLNYNWHQLLFVVNSIAFAMLLSLSGYILKQARKGIFTFSYRGFFTYFLQKSPVLFLLAFGIHGILLIPLKTSFFLFMLFVPLSMVCIGEMAEDKFKWKGIGYYFRKFIAVNLLYVPLLILSIMLALLAHSAIAFLHVELIKWNIPFNEDLYALFQNFSISWMLMFTVFFQIAMISVNMGLMYFSMRETYTAEDLKNRLSILSGNKNKSIA